MTMYLENALTLDEYRDMKNKLMNEKQLLKEKLSDLEQKNNNRFELTEKFLKFNMELVNDRTNEENIHLFKKVGSNFRIKDRTLLFERSAPWEILAGARFGGNLAQSSVLRTDAFFRGKPDYHLLRRGEDLNLRRL